MTMMQVHNMKDALEEFLRSHPGFSSGTARDMVDIAKQYDVVFCGPPPALESRGCAILAEVAKVPLVVERPTRLGFFIGNTKGSQLPAGICMNAQGEVGGLELLRALAWGKIVLDAGPEPAESGSSSIRIFEATAVGSFLLTAASEAVKYFEPGREMETFGTAAELKEKINYYLDHDREREEIARRGQQRCLTDYWMESSAGKGAAITDGEPMPLIVRHVLAPKRMSLLQARQRPSLP